MIKIGQIATALGILTTIGGMIVAGTLWVSAQTQKVDTVVDKMEVVVKLQETERDKISKSIDLLEEKMLKKEDLDKFKIEIQAENDYIVNHLNDPIEDIKQDIKDFRTSFEKANRYYYYQGDVVFEEIEE